MLKFLIWIPTLLLPCLVFLMLGRFLCAFGAFMLQMTLIGWIPAMIWARKTWITDMGITQGIAKNKENIK